MAELSNPTARVMEVLNFLAAHPSEAFTLAEIARQVGLSNGSAHRLLTTLAAGQFLSRNDKHRTYSLGVALVAVGQAAIERHRGIDIARRELARLAAELRVQCSANALVDGDVVVLVKEGSAKSHLGLTRVGERRPLVPPIGLCHVAWGGETALADYLRPAADHLSAEVENDLREALSLIRSRGYAVAGVGPHAESIRQALLMPGGEARDADLRTGIAAMIEHLSRDDIQAFDLGRAAAAGVSYIAAPVFSPAGSVAFTLVLSGIPKGIGKSGIEAHAERLRAAAATITSEIHGRVPAGN